MRKVVMLCATAVGLLASGCDKVPTDENLAKKAVRERLSDPDSAQFSEIFKGPESGGALCGLVNAKNRMGGYVGRTPFYYSKASGDVSLVSEPPEDRDFIAYYDAVGGPNAIEKQLELSRRCNAATDWELVCGRKLNMPTHRFCAMMNDSGASMTFMRALSKLAKGE